MRSKSKFVVPALQALVFVIVLAGMASATVYKRTDLEIPQGYNLTFSLSVSGNLVSGILTDQRWIAVGGINALACAWDRNTGSLVATTSPGTVNSVCLLPGGKLAVSDEDGVTKTLDPLTGETALIEGLQNLSGSNAGGDIVGNFTGLGYAVRKADGSMVPLQGGGTAYEISGKGQVIGERYVDGAYVGTLWDSDGSVLANLGFSPMGINDSGAVVGWQWAKTGNKAFIWEEGQTTEITGLGSTYLYGISNDGRIAGRSYPTSGEERSFIRDKDGTVSWLPVGDHVEGITKDGILLGYFTDGQDYHAGVWQAVPEPNAALSLCGMIGMGAGVLTTKRRRRR